MNILGVVLPCFFIFLYHPDQFLSLLSHEIPPALAGRSFSDAIGLIIIFYYDAVEMLYECGNNKGKAQNLWFSVVTRDSSAKIGTQNYVEITGSNLRTGTKDKSAALS